MKQSFMSIGGNCIDIAILGDLRLKGPVDNMFAQRGLLSCKSLFEKTFEDEIFNSEPLGIIQNYRDNPYPSVVFPNYAIIHNDYFSDSFKKELKLRILNFNNFNGLFVYTLNTADLYGNAPSVNFLLGLDYLRSKNLIDRVLFVGQNVVKGTLNTAEGWCINSLPVKYRVGINYIEISDIDMVHSKQNQLEFQSKIAEKFVYY